MCVDSNFLWCVFVCVYVCVYCVSILYCVLCGSGDYRLPPLGIWSRAWEWINPWRSCSQTNYWFFTARADEKTQGIDTPERKELEDTRHLCFGNCSIPIPTQRVASGRIYPREARTRWAKEQYDKISRLNCICIWKFQNLKYVFGNMSGHSHPERSIREDLYKIS